MIPKIGRGFFMTRKVVYEAMGPRMAEETKVIHPIDFPPK